MQPQAAPPFQAPTRTILPHERRASPRRPVDDRVTLIETGRADSPALQRISSIHLKDMSSVGLGGLSERPLDVGARVAMCFPPHGPTPGFDWYGTVVRCDARADRYEVGVALDQSSAAC